MKPFAPATASQRYYFYFVSGIIFLIFLFCYVHRFNPPVFPLDDSYIVLHNAQVLHQGYDANYPGISALAGSTSPIYLLLISLLLFVAPPLWTLIISAWLAIFFYLWGLLRLAAIFQISLIQTFLFILCGFSFGYTLYQLFNGLETGWIMAAVTWVFVLSQDNIRGIEKNLRNILLGLLPFLHSELIILTFLLWCWQGHIYWRQSHNKKAVFKLLLEDSAWILLSAAPWLIWYKINLGSFFPNTLLAKQFFYAQRTWPLYLKWQTFLGNVAGFLIIFGYFNIIGMALLLMLTGLGRTGLIFILSFFGIYFFNAPFAISFNVERYIYAIVPIFLYGLISGLQYPDRSMRLLANGILLFSLLFSLWQLPSRWHLYTDYAYATQMKLKNVRDWCVRNLPPSSIILVHDAGYMAWSTQFHLVDLVGLKTPAAMNYHREFTFTQGGINRPEAVAAIINNMHPAYLIVLPQWQKAFKVTQLAEYGWNFQLLYAEPQEGYRVYKIVRV